jgi:hypothetical protein
MVIGYQPGELPYFVSRTRIAGSQDTALGFKTGTGHAKKNTTGRSITHQPQHKHTHTHQRDLYASATSEISDFLSSHTFNI